jgi:hypothetical protein
MAMDSEIRKLNRKLLKGLDRPAFIDILKGFVDLEY